jgi:hypothetical protein
LSLNSSPPSLAAVIRLATRTLVAHLTPIAMAAAVVVFPMTIWEGALPTLQTPSSTATLAELRALVVAMRPWLWPAIVDGAASFLMGAAVVWMLTEAMSGRVAGPWDGYRAVFGRLGRLVTAALAELGVIVVASIVLVGLPVLVGATTVLPVTAIALAVFAILFGVYLSLVTQVVMRQGLGFTAALRQSTRLVSGAFWPVLGLIIIGAVVSALFSTLSSLPASGGTVTFATRAFAELISALVAVTAGLYPTALLTAFYMERTEGADPEAAGAAS